MNHLTLNNGLSLPQVGYGFWKVPNEKTAQMVQDAIKAGYRHLDCACDYGNETEVGAGIKEAISSGLCTRDDLWVTSKLWNTYHAPEHVGPAVKKSLHDLGLDYLDLYLIHFPIAQAYVDFETRYPPGWFFDPDVENPHMEFADVPISDTWQAMEELVDQGLVKTIGISNFGTSLIRDLLTRCRIRPSVLQIESHPYLTQEKLIAYCAQEKIGVTAFSPLGALSYLSLNMANKQESLLENEEILKIASRVGKSSAQVILRWGVQRGTAIIPKTESLERLKENIAIFDFELTDAEMATISGMNQNRRFNDPGDFCEAAFNTFCPIYE